MQPSKTQAGHAGRDLINPILSDSSAPLGSAAGLLWKGDLPEQRAPHLGMLHLGELCLGRGTGVAPPWQGWVGQELLWLDLEKAREKAACPGGTSLPLCRSLTARTILSVTLGSATSGL